MARAPVLRDSAGVSILEIPATLAAAAHQDSLSDPIWVLGTAGGELDADMSGVTSAAFAAGTIVLADEFGGMLQQFSLDGSLLNTGAGRGEGPGEMPMMGTLTRYASGSEVAVLEYFRGILHIYDDTLGFVGQQRLRDLPGGTRYVVIGRERDGSLIAFGGPQAALDVGEDGVIVRLPEVVERIVADRNRIDTLFTLPGNETYAIADGIRGRRFAMRPALIVHDNGFVVSDGEHWDLRWLDRDGGLQRIVRVDRPRRVVTEEMRTEQLRLDHAEIDELPPGGFVGIRRMAELDFADPRFPDSLPPFDLALGEPDGRIWLREGSAPSDTMQHWLIFGAEDLEAVVRISSRLRVLAVRDSLVLVRREDDDGVGYLELRKVVP